MNERWNLDRFYTGFEDPAYEADVEQLKETIEQLTAFAGDLGKGEPGDCLREGLLLREKIQKLAGKLAKPERVMLLRLIGLEDALRYEACLNSFFSGYRLASGIHRELEEIPPYSFATEDEQQARKQAEKEREEG